MSAPTPAPAPANKGKLMIVIGALVALLIVAGAGAFLFLKNKQAAEAAAAEEEEAAPAPVVTVPVFMPIEAMVVNLADPGGERFAQIGITLELRDAKTEDQIKQLMPSIRSGILMIISQRTADELLMREGKSKLAADILVDIGRNLGVPPQTARTSDDEDAGPPRPRNPVRRVLFSSFLIQ